MGKCDFSLCQKCHKKAIKEMEAELLQQEEEDDFAAIVEAVCEANIEPIRQGRKLQFRCTICGTTLASQDAAATHIVEKHEDEIRSLSTEMREDDFATGGGFLGDGFLM